MISYLFWSRTGLLVIKHAPFGTYIDSGQSWTYVRRCCCQDMLSLVQGACEVLDIMNIDIPTKITIFRSEKFSQNKKCEAEERMKENAKHTASSKGKADSVLRHPGSDHGYQEEKNIQGI